jgi:hypothetical protein
MQTLTYQKLHSLLLNLTCHEHININSTIQQYITSYKVHKRVLRGNPNGRKPFFFSYILEDYIHRKHVGSRPKQKERQFWERGQAQGK